VQASPANDAARSARESRKQPDDINECFMDWVL
jgi:hypothetical protein